MSVYPHQVGAVDQWRVRLQTVQRQAVLIVSLFAMSVVVYAVIGFVLARSGSEAPSDLRAPFLIAALALSFGSIGLRRVMLSRARLESVAASRGLKGVIGYIFNITVISSAIGETIGILALVVSFLGGQQIDVLILGAIGLMIVLSNYPRRAAWTNTIEYLAAELPKEYHER